MPDVRVDMDLMVLAQAFKGAAKCLHGVDTDARVSTTEQAQEVHAALRAMTAKRSAKIAADLRLLGVTSPQDLLGKDPYKMYDDLCDITEVRQDPCVIDVFIAAVRFMTGEVTKPWWKYTQERKRTLAAKKADKHG